MRSPVKKNQRLPRRRRPLGRRKCMYVYIHIYTYIYIYIYIHIDIDINICLIYVVIKTVVSTNEQQNVLAYVS